SRWHRHAGASGSGYPAGRSGPPGPAPRRAGIGCKLGVHRRAARLLDLLLSRPEGLARSHLALGGPHLCNRWPAGCSRHPKGPDDATCRRVEESTAQPGTFMEYLLLAAVRAPAAAIGALSCAADSEDRAGHPAPPSTSAAV